MRASPERQSGVPDASERVAGEDHWATAVNGARTWTRSASSEIESLETSNESNRVSESSVFDFHAYRSARMVVSTILSCRAKAAGTTSELRIVIDHRLGHRRPYLTTKTTCNSHERVPS